MIHPADSMDGVRENCVISVTTLRTEGSLATFLEMAQSSTLQTSIRPYMTISKNDLVYTTVKTRAQ